VDRVVATLASRNAHKARELERLMPGWTIAPLDAEGWPEETGATYYENALLKATFGHGLVGGWTIGEDSGIEVHALGGRPGLQSARYAPEGRPAIEKLLGELEGVEDRRAHYVSELVAIAPGGDVLRGSGIVEGVIANAPRGSGTQTVGELGDDWKARNSHRARSARALREAVDRSGLGGA
jgi:XTP/dITP diphosphohydrolase